MVKKTCPVILLGLRLDFDERETAAEFILKGAPRLIEMDRISHHGGRHRALA